MAVYISTFCLAGSLEENKVLPGLFQAGLKNIELGAMAIPENAAPQESLPHGINFIAHNYFLKPANPVILNLASPNPKILQRSREYVLKSIDFCHKAGIRFYTIHAGFRIDPDLNLNFDKEGSVPAYDKSFDIFVESVKKVNDYAERKGIRIGIENNVLSQANLVGGENKLLLLCEAEEFEELWNRIPSDNLGMLLDLGHLKVTARSLGFDRYKFIEKVKNKVFALHIHDNNETIDEHKMLGRESWCFDIIRQPEFADSPIVLESLKLTITEAVAQVRLIEVMLKKQS
jgi:sugar phosphate isomerase/epimerase